MGNKVFNYCSIFISKNPIDLYLLSTFPIWPPAIQSILIVITIIIRYSVSRLENSFYFNKSNLFIYIFLFAFSFFNYLSFFWSDNKTFFFKEINYFYLLNSLGFIFLFFKRHKLDFTSYKIVLLLLNLSFLLYIFVFFYNITEGISVYNEIMTNEQDIRSLNFVEKIIYILKEKIDSFGQEVTPQYKGIRGDIMSGNHMFFYHHTYTGLYSILLLILNYASIEKMKNNKKLLLFFSSFLVIIYILFIDSVLTYLSFLFLILLVIKNKFKSFFLLLIIIFSILFFILLYINDVFLFQKDPNVYNGLYLFDYNRYFLFISSFKIIKENIFFGLGVGDYLIELNRQFSAITKTKSLNLNSHSQYLYYFLSGGLINLLLFFMTQFYILIKSYKFKYKITFLFTLIISLYLTFENMFQRNWGIFTICFFLYLSFLIDNKKIVSCESNKN